jgi:hypothetical protein
MQSAGPIRTNGPLYAEIAGRLDYTDEYSDCILRTVQNLIEQATTAERPGMLLGLIQSGKTRTFLGVIAVALDNGFDNCIILTKGTRALAGQTLVRVRKAFRAAIENDDARVFDIMSLPENLTPYERSLKLIVVCKKEDDNLRRLERALCDTYPDLSQRRTLILDDEADMASLGFRTRDGLVELAVIPAQIERLRNALTNAGYLQVTATPYSLYLQPSSDQVLPDGVYHPLRPAFTELVPVHGHYVGGREYFELSEDPDHPAYYFQRSVDQQELDALRREDGRRLRIEDVLVSPRIPAMRHSICAFVVGGSIRRLQQRRTSDRRPKYSFIFHLDRAREAHRWQERVVREIVDQLCREADADTARFRALMRQAYDDLARSVERSNQWLPSFEEVLEEVHVLLPACMVTKVNSDNDVQAMLDDEGQLELRNPLNVFIGGQILDRGLTVAGVIGFYYGRNPQRFQQDTVLQHCRMYGARPLADLGVTRFYTSDRIHGVLRRIHQFDQALREAFRAHGQDAGVVFVTQHGAGLVACSPNKLSLSSIETLRSGGRALPIGFDIARGARARRTAEEIDSTLREAGDDSGNNVFEISMEQAVELIRLASSVYEFSPGYNWDVDLLAAQLRYVSTQRGETILCSVRRDREIRRLRPNGRPANAPDTSQREGAVARADATRQPILFMIQQRGGEDLGWKNGPFWWPVIYWPQEMRTVIFSDELEPTRENGDEDVQRAAAAVQ